MAAYLLKRLLLIIPTLFGIMLINFVIIQFAPGGPIEQVIANLTGTSAGATSSVSGGGGDGLSGGAQPGGLDNAAGDTSSKYRGAQGLDPEFIKELEAQFGFDKPAHVRFLNMLADYARLDFGESFYRGARVTDLIIEKLPVSLSLGLWTTLIVYLISIPLGVRKAVRDGSRFDIWTSGGPFLMMGIGSACVLLFAIYVRVRYGAHTPTA